MLDMFSGNAFTTVSLTRTFNRVPNIPTLLGSMGIFEPVPIRDKIAAIEQRSGRLIILNTTQRGTPVQERPLDERNLRALPTRRIAEGSTIYADTLQSVQNEADATGVGTTILLQDEIARRYTGPAGIQTHIDLTLEHMRLGAVQGITVDADGSTLDNFYTLFGVAQAAEVNFALTTATTDVRGKCNAIRRAMRRASQGSWVEGVTEVHALAGDNFFDKLVSHPNVVATYLNWQAAQELRNANEFESFYFGGIYWHNYQGTDDYDKNATTGTARIGVDPDRAKFFPVRSPGVFQHIMAPAEFFPWINTPGQRIYGIQFPDRDRQAWHRLEAYSYPLLVCTNPAMLQRAIVA